MSSVVEGAAISAAPSAPRDWAKSFGRLWKLDLTVMAIVVILFGAIRPLGDPDLPMRPRGGGVWENSWQPSSAALQVKMVVNAFEQGLR